MIMAVSLGQNSPFSGRLNVGLAVSEHGSQQRASVSHADPVLFHPAAERTSFIW